MNNFYVFYGEDDFSLNEALEEVVERMELQEPREANISVLRGEDLDIGQFQGLGSTVPFLAPARLLLIDGLLGMFEGSGGRRRGARSQARRDLSSWSRLPDVLALFPSTTWVVFRDAWLNERNPLLTALRPVATVHSFPTVMGERLRDWITERIERKGGHLTQEALRWLMDLIGGNLWTLNTELEKLSLYVTDRSINVDDVQLLVSRLRDISIFTVVDAVLEGRWEMGVTHIRRMLAGGISASYILSMMVRQIRLVRLAKELGTTKLHDNELVARLGVSSPFVARKSREQSRRYTVTQLNRLYRSLLDADIAIKSGQPEEDTLEALVMGMKSR